MTAPRLVGPQVALVPVAAAVADAVVDGRTDDLEPLLQQSGLRPGTGWPHADSAGALAGAGSGVPVAAEDLRCWLVTAGGEVLGECGWKHRPDPDGTVELTYGLAAPARGRGLGTEAVALVVAWSERQPGVRRLAADVLVGNEPSRRLLRRLGFVEQPVDGRQVRAERGEPRIRGRHVC
ncbi:MAG TPA: GNAT family N-acetyltransferase [Mycobacteriales bacterium]|nr:GNAT family N-acetyltransferase [Mycobacteriales bacterium]